jgi:hypothetical protein
VDKVCVAIQAGSAAELTQRAEVALADSKFLEFRLDSLPKPAAALPKVKEFLAEHREATAIATCRRKEFGGNFEGSLKAEFEVLAAAAEAGCQIVDVEVESAEEAAPRQWDRLRDRLRPPSALAGRMRVALLVAQLMMDAMGGHPEDRPSFQSQRGADGHPILQPFGDFVAAMGK